MEYRSRDSVFLTPLSSWIIDENSLVTFVDNRHIYDSRVLIIHPDFRLLPQDHVFACCMVVF